MKTVYYPHDGREDLPRACYALGFFDGVHIGHRRLIAECVKMAGELGLVPAVFTFSSEGEELKRGAPRLTSTAEKLSIFAEMGVELAVVADFSAVSGLTPREFVADLLVARHGCRGALSGEGFRFGRGASGDASELVALLGEHSLPAVIVEDILYTGAPISSTRIREALGGGDMTLVRELLGRPYSVSGIVSHGNGMGNKIGIPTVNIAINANNPLQNGVYASRVRLGERSFAGITNVGTCPTLGERERHSETLIFDFCEDAYGAAVTVELLKFLRPERCFRGVSDLLLQVNEDIRRAKEYVGKMD